MAERSREALPLSEKVKALDFKKEGRKIIRRVVVKINGKNESCSQEIVTEQEDTGYLPHISDCQSSGHRA